jgi:hypothetical protein
MGVVPRNQAEKITYFQSHVDQFAAHAAEIGTTEAAVAELAARAEAARAAYAAAGAARQRARAATLDLKLALDALDAAGQSVLGQVRARAAVAGEAVYPVAQIRPPAKPSPLGPPGTPADFAVQLLTGGAVELTWKCRHPKGSSGTLYRIFRRTGVDGPFAYLGGDGRKRLVDATEPAGTARVTYRVQAVRSTAAGEAAEFSVEFGVAGGAAPAGMAVAEAARRAA